MIYEAKDVSEFTFKHNLNIEIYNRKYNTNKNIHKERMENKIYVISKRNSSDYILKHHIIEMSYTMFNMYTYTHTHTHIYIYIFVKLIMCVYIYIYI